MKKYKLLKDFPGIPAGTELGPRWFSEWFSEIPDYSFVRDGDVYKTGGEFVMCRGGRANAFSGDLATYKKEITKEKEWITAFYKNHYENKYIKPENLVYRPGKNPWDTPLVDKLGWGPMEPKKKEFTVNTLGIAGDPLPWVVWEDCRISHGAFHTREDAELFKRALEGK